MKKYRVKDPHPNRSVVIGYGLISKSEHIRNHVDIENLKVKYDINPEADSWEINGNVIKSEDIGKFTTSSHWLTRGDDNFANTEEVEELIKRGFAMYQVVEDTSNYHEVEFNFEYGEITWECPFGGHTVEVCSDDVVIDEELVCEECGTTYTLVYSKQASENYTKCLDLSYSGASIKMEFEINEDKE